MWRQVQRVLCRRLSRLRLRLQDVTLRFGVTLLVAYSNRRSSIATSPCSSCGLASRPNLNEIFPITVGAA